MKNQSYPNLLVVLTALLMLAWPRSGWAQFNFIINPDNTIIITRYTVEGYPAGGIQLTIPNTINGYPVTTIGTNAFANKAFLTSVTIPDSVTSIRNHAFDGLYHLRSVTIGNSVTTIGDGAFESCSLGSVTIPDSVTSIGYGPLAACGGLTNIDVATANPSYTSAGGVLFNKTLTTLVEYPGGLAGSYAIPDSVTSIGNHAFDGCYGLTSVAIGSSVTNIGDAAFAACSGLSNIHVDAGNPSYASAGGALFDKAMSTLVEYPGGLAGSYSIPDSVSRIGDCAFDSCYSLTNVTIPNTVTNIGDESFYRCSKLASVTIPDSVTSIGDGAFLSCSLLTNIDVDAANPSYTSADGVLFNKTLTTLIQYPGGLAGSYAIPDSVTNIGGGAFEGCSGLSSAIIPDSVTSLGDNAFNSCWNLTSVTIGSGVTSIGDGAFLSCSLLTNVAIPNSVTSLGDYAFKYCSGLTSVTIPNSVTNIGGGAFWRCSGLTSVTIGDHVTSIGDGAFFGCWRLTSVTIPDGVTSLGDYAFEYCSGLTNVAIPDSVTNIGGGAFGGCYRLTSVTIGNSVTSIGADAFLGCSRLTSVTVPDSVTSIGQYAFASCTSLHQAYFQGNAPSVNGGAGGADYTVFQWESGWVYYVPGTTGWAAYFGGWPTAPWYRPRPQILGPGYGLGAGSNGFQFTISWATNAAVVVEASTNLQDWTPVSTNLVNGTNIFWDSDWTNYPQRFYRVGVEQ